MPGMPRSRRRDTRYSIRFPVRLSYAQRTRALLTEDVSHGGIFVCTDTPPPLLQLVRVQLVLPVGDHALQAHGMTVHLVTGDNARSRVPGFGVYFYALPPSTREVWEQFIRHVELHYPKSPDQVPLRLPRGTTPDPLRRRLERHMAVLKVAPATLEALNDLYTRDISTGSLFIETPLDLPSGTRVVVHVVHPHHAQPYLLEAIVLHRESAPREGLGVELVGVDRTLRDDFLDFARGGILIASETVLPDSGDDDDRDI